MLPPDVAQLHELDSAPANGDQAVTEGEGTAHLADLLDEIVALIQRYIQLPDPDLALVIAGWITLTYLHHRVPYCGYLALRSATPRCGKSRLLRIIALVAMGTPPITTMPTAAALFRTTRQVLILDEVDRLRNADRDTFGDVLAVLNCGFEQGAIVERVEKVRGEGFAVKSYGVYGPKALAGIETLADTLADRCFTVQMKRTPQRMPRLNVRRLEGGASKIRLGLEMWAVRHGEEVEAAYEQLPTELESLVGFDDRFQDISEPLVVVASLADAERPFRPEGPRAVLPRLLNGLNVAAGRREPSGRERELLAFLNICEAMLKGTEQVFVKSAELVAACQEREELSRIETGRALAGFLHHFDLHPRSNGRERGYMLSREWAESWGRRYGERRRGEQGEG